MHEVALTTIWVELPSCLSGLNRQILGMFVHTANYSEEAIAVKNPLHYFFIKTLKFLSSLMNSSFSCSCISRNNLKTNIVKANVKLILLTEELWNNTQSSGRTGFLRALAWQSNLLNYRCSIIQNCTTSIKAFKFTFCHPSTHPLPKLCYSRFHFKYCRSLTDSS